VIAEDTPDNNSRRKTEYGGRRDIAAGRTGRRRLLHIHHLRIVRRHINYFWIRRLDDDHFLRVDGLCFDFLFGR
jgi:hypothetical protein